MNSVDDAAAGGTMLADLSQHAFVAGMERRLVEQLADCAHIVRYDSGALMAKAEEQEGTYLLTEGEVELETVVAGGRVSSVVRLGAGDVLRVDHAAAPDWTQYVRAVGAVSAIALDDSALNEQMDQNADLRSALRMCAIRYARIHSQREHPAT